MGAAGWLSQYWLAQKVVQDTHELPYVGCLAIKQGRQGDIFMMAPMPTLLDDVLTVLLEGGDGSGSHSTPAGEMGVVAQQ